MSASEFDTAFQDFCVPTFQDQFGVLVCLARGPRSTAEFSARRSDRMHSTMGAEYGLEVKVAMRDFILPVASIVIDGETIEPRVGDRIVEGEEVFEVLAPDASRPAVELLSGDFEYLVHTKRIE